MGIEGVAEKLEDTATLLAAGGDHRPDAFTPTLSAFATGSLRDVTVDHDVPNRLFRLVVRRFDPRCRQEAKVVVRLMAAKAVCQSKGLGTRRRVADHLKKSSLDPIHRSGKTRLRHVLGPMPGVKQFPDPQQELLAPAGERLVGVFGAVTDLPDGWDQPANFTRADRTQTQWDFRFVHSLADNLRYQDAVRDIQRVIRPAEGRFLRLQPQLEKAAAEVLANAGARAAGAFVAEYTQCCMKQVGYAYHELVDYLMLQYLLVDADVAPPDLPIVAAPVIPGKPATVPP